MTRRRRLLLVAYLPLFVLALVAMSTLTVVGCSGGGTGYGYGYDPFHSFTP